MCLGLDISVLARVFLAACLGHQSPLKKKQCSWVPPPVPQVSPGKYLVSTCDPVKSGWATRKGAGVSENCQLQGNPLVIRAYFYGELSQKF
jgi:hypothetical protein